MRAVLIINLWKGSLEIRNTDIRLLSVLCSHGSHVWPKGSSSIMPAITCMWSLRSNRPLLWTQMSHMWIESCIYSLREVFHDHLDVFHGHRLYHLWQELKTYGHRDHTCVQWQDISSLVINLVMYGHNEALTGQSPDVYGHRNCE